MRAAWPALVLAGVILLPFLGKAYTIDDPVFLREAQQLLTDPLHPSAFEMVWTSERRLRASSFLPGGPAMAYLLLPLSLADWQEWASHLLMLMCFALTIFGTATLAGTLGLSWWVQRSAALFVASAPVALGMASTVMPDIPAAMFTVWGIERYIVWVRTRRWSAGLATACLLALAVLTRINLLLMVGIAGLWGIRHSWRLVLPLALSGALVLTGFVITQDPNPSGGTPISAAKWLLRFDRTGFHFLALVIAYLLTTPLLAVLLTRRRVGEYGGLLWGWLLLPVPAIVYFSFAPKYVLPALPAVALLAAAGLDRLPYRQSILNLIVAGGTLLGVLIVRADARMAGAARTAAAELIRPRIERGERVWFAGHLGFHWYAEEAGAMSVAIEPPFPSPGETLVAQTWDEPGMLCFLPRVPLEEYGDKAVGGVVMNRRASAGFYSDIFGLWPWGWAAPDTTPFLVSRITALPTGSLDRSMRPHWCGPQ